MSLIYIVALGGVSLLAGFQSTAQVRWLFDLLLLATRNCGYSLKEFAAWSNQSRSQLDQQIAGKQHASLYRASMCPPDVLRAWIKLMADRLDLVVLDRGELSAMVEEHRASRAAIQQLLVVMGGPAQMRHGEQQERRRA